MVILGCSAVILVAGRLHLMGSRAPEFAPADNPAADSVSLLTRTLTFLYLPSFNFWLLVQPSVLSFDWSMEAIPLITSVADVRNLVSCLFYCTLAYAFLNIWQLQNRRRDSDASASMYVNPGSTVSAVACNSETLRNGHCHSQTATSSSNNSNVLASLINSNSGYACNSWASTANASYPISYDSINLTVIALSMLVLPFIPATNLFFYVGFVVAERILYIPSIGFCLIIAIGCHLIHDVKLRNEKWKLAFRMAIIFIFILYSAKTIIRLAY